MVKKLPLYHCNPFLFVSWNVSFNLFIIKFNLYQYDTLYLGIGYTYQDLDVYVIRVLSEISSLKPFFYAYNNM